MGVATGPLNRPNFAHFWMMESFKAAAEGRDQKYVIAITACL